MCFICLGWCLIFWKLYIFKPYPYRRQCSVKSLTVYTCLRVFRFTIFCQYDKSKFHRLRPIRVVMILITWLVFFTLKLRDAIHLLNWGPFCWLFCSHIWRLELCKTQFTDSNLLLSLPHCNWSSFCVKLSR